MIRIPPGQGALFASDMHLSDACPETAAYFLACLADQARSARYLFLLGDLFDAWVGDDLIGSPGEEACVQRFTEALRAWADQGKVICVMRGNRDFLLGTAPGEPRAQHFCTATGAHLLTDPCMIELHGTRVALAHGDALCTDDTDYQAFRQLARSAAWQRDFLAQPLPMRLAAARAMREQSEHSKSAKNAELMDVNADAVAALLRETACQILIHGHTHRPAHHRFDLDGNPAQRWVLPDWDATATAPPRGGLLLAQDGELSTVGAWPAPLRAAYSTTRSS